VDCRQVLAAWAAGRLSDLVPIYYEKRTQGQIVSRSSFYTSAKQLERVPIGSRARFFSRRSTKSDTVLGGPLVPLKGALASFRARSRWENSRRSDLAEVRYILELGLFEIAPG